MAGAGSERPYGRHPAIVTADRLADAAKRWAAELDDYELDAIDVVRCALDRIAEPRVRPEAKCGTQSGYQKHQRRGEETCTECRAAHAAALMAYRKTGTTRRDCA